MSLSGHPHTGYGFWQKALPTYWFYFSWLRARSGKDLGLCTARQHRDVRDTRFIACYNPLTSFVAVLDSSVCPGRIRSQGIVGVRLLRAVRSLRPEISVGGPAHRVSVLDQSETSADAPSWG